MLLCVNIQMTGKIIVQYQRSNCLNVTREMPTIKPGVAAESLELVNHLAQDLARLFQNGCRPWGKWEWLKCLKAQLSVLLIPAVTTGGKKRTKEKASTQRSLEIFDTSSSNNGSVSAQPLSAFTLICLEALRVLLSATVSL